MNRILNKKHLMEKHEGCISVKGIGCANAGEKQREQM